MFFNHKTAFLKTPLESEDLVRHTAGLLNTTQCCSYILRSCSPLDHAQDDVKGQARMVDQQQLAIAGGLLLLLLLGVLGAAAVLLSRKTQLDGQAADARQVSLFIALLLCAAWWTAK